jgi:hypothetical protein
MEQFTKGFTEGYARHADEAFADFTNKMPQQPRFLSGSS